MRNYLDTLGYVLEAGRSSDDRTGTGTNKLFGLNMEFDLTEGFPLVTTKKIYFKAVVAELIWFLSGSTNNKDLNQLGTTIWDEWALEDGDLGPIYGKQWRDWDVTSSRDITSKLETLLCGTRTPTREELIKVLKDEADKPKSLDQLAELVNTLRTNPNDRRMIVTAWNPTDLPDSSISPHDNVRLGKVSLPACHTMFQVGTSEMSIMERSKCAVHAHGMDIVPPGVNTYSLTKELMDEHNVPTHNIHLSVYLRSQDLMLGTPFNIASYALLLEMLAMVTGMQAKRLIWNAGDAHIYKNHTQAAIEQIDRVPYLKPKLIITPGIKDLSDFTTDSFSLLNYDHHPSIKLDVAV